MSQPPALRRADKQMPEPQLREFLEQGFCGRLASGGADGWPYVVPLLYVLRGGEIWVHNTRARGHLRANVEHDSRVCFEIDEPGEVFPYGRFECDTSVAYRSALVFGRIRIVDDVSEKQAFFEAFMSKYAPPDWARPQHYFPRLDEVTVYAIHIERMTGKEAALPAAENRWPRLDRTKSPGAKPPDQ